MQISISEMKRKVFFGLGLSMNEQRWLLEQLTGEPITRLRRCDKCDTTGCRACDGKGHVFLPPEPVELVA
jgi:hypothetical protein